MRPLFVAGMLLLAGCVGAATPRTRPVPLPGWSLIVLGIAQDGGMPHLGCDSGPCLEAKMYERLPERVACLGLINKAKNKCYLFDATPDLPSQIVDLTHTVDRPRKRPVDGIFLTHGHIGHYTGLMYLGKETLGADAVPVYATPRMNGYLTANGPWSLLVKDRHIDIKVMEPGTEVRLDDEIVVSSFTVPHRDEFTDTVGYRIQGPNRTALFIPDIDKWEKWAADSKFAGRIEEHVKGVDLAFLDCTFATTEELGHRDPNKVPHPLLGETVDLLKGMGPKVKFIHLNHTNPLMTEGPLRTALEKGGFRVCNDGDVYQL